MPARFLRRSLLLAASGIGVSSTGAAADGAAPSLPRPDLSGLFETNKRYTAVIIERARRFMALPPPRRGQTNERVALEMALFGFLEDAAASPADVLSAMKGAGIIAGRAWGMQLLWRQRQAGRLAAYGLNPLDEQRTAWALAHGIDPRLRAVYRDSLFAATELLRAAPDLFFEAKSGRDRERLVYADTLPNPGALATLSFTETGYTTDHPDPISRYWAGTFIGGGCAWDELNLDARWFPSGRSDLLWIGQRLQAATGLPYLDCVRTIPGSERGDIPLNGSEGAIGPQFMPINARLFMGWYDAANARPGFRYPPANPFAPFVAEILTALYLAAQWYHRHGDVDRATAMVRPGYGRYASDAFKVNVFRKWNPTRQARQALDAGYGYYVQFGRV